MAPGWRVLELQVPLQRITILLPADHTVGGLSFVLRSADRTMWWVLRGPGRGSGVQDVVQVARTWFGCQAVAPVAKMSCYCRLGRGERNGRGRIGARGPGL